MAGGLGATQCKRCLEEMDIEVKVVDGSIPWGFFFGCEVHASSGSAHCRETHNNTQP